MATTSLFVISSAAAHAQALAPSTLNLTSPEQETKKDIVPAIPKEPAQVIAREKSPEQETKKDIVQAITKQPVRATTKKSLRAITKEPMQALAKEPVRAVAKEPVQAMTKKPIKAITQKAAQPIPKDSARTFAIEPVRPMDQQSTSTPRQSAFHFSFKTPEGKKESAPVVTQYYPQRIVYPFAKVDRHIDSRLMQAATIAQERAHAHSRSRCWRYVKDALLASGVIDSRPKTELARDAAQELVSNYGFKKLSVSDPFAAPVGSVLVYGTTRSVGHVELRTRDGFVSDFRSPTPSRRPLVGVYAKL
ncbi:MAG: NlpC/P60 family protein [Verrucomicrobia bacterium]|nr:MAG: NlpC/P60 family protein [Verrucomicrobiota bacterium]